MSWVHRFNRMLARGNSAAKGGDSAPTPPTEPAEPEAPKAKTRKPAPDPIPEPDSAPRSRPSRAGKSDDRKRPISPHLAARAAAVKAVAEAMRKAHNQAEAAANARAVLARMGVNIPAPQPTGPLLTGDRRALIHEAMSHWARGHAIYERLDPSLKERVRALAERMAPK